MTQPYLIAFRRAVAEMERKREKSEISEISSKGLPLNSLNSLNSHLSELERRCPPYVEAARWQQCVSDGHQFLNQWGSQAAALGWDGDSLFGLHPPPDHPHPTYDPLGRHDDAGLCWYLRGRGVTALSSETAAIQP